MPRAPLGAIGVAVLLAVAPTRATAATLIPGGGGRRTDCILQMSADGVGFPVGKTPKGVSCADGDVCDLDGRRNGVCLFRVSFCLNEPTRACQPRTVQRAGVRTKKNSPVDAAPMQAALGAIPLPTRETVCSPTVLVPVPLAGPNRRGVVAERRVVVKGSARAGRQRDSDTYKLTCVPTTVAGGAPPTTTPVSTTTSTTTRVPLPPARLGGGLISQITGTTVSASGTVAVSFTLTDGNGNPVTPVTAATTDPDQAQVAFTIARLELDPETQDGFTTTFTRYVSYVTTPETIAGMSIDQPGLDSGGTLATVDPTTGLYTYTFATTLPPGFPAGLTHTVGGQILRTFDGAMLVANPVFDFVPAGGPVTTVRELTTTAQCNGCHDPLEAHPPQNGKRREVRLCQLCHTAQGFDAEGNSIEFENMIHRIHRGQDLPSIVNGAIGAKYASFAAKVKACSGGPLASVVCTTDADCAGGTCTGTTTTGVAFPQDIRTCTKCHAEGATASDYLNKPSPSACTGCHDDVNPSRVTTQAGPPGTNHGPNGLIGPQSSAVCVVCHQPTGNEFDITIPGAHTVPERSTQLTGLVGELLSASGSPGAPVTITFRLTDGAGTPLSSLAGLGTLALAISGPSSDFGGLTPPVTTPALIGGSASGTLAGPDGSGVFTYTTTGANGIPAGGTGTWRVGMEARRPVTVNGQTVQEAMQNVVLDFSVDGSAVVPRRAVVDQAKCASCHGVFSQGFSIHGNLRNRVEYCVICHNPNMSDFARRAGVSGADPNTQPIDLKHMLHKIHTGENLTQQPYVIYGFGGSVNDFGDVLFPGNRADCEKCHLPDTFLLPLPAGVLPTQLTTIISGVNTPVGSIPPIQDACLACHDDGATAAHAATNTASGGAEACPVCHGESGIEPVSTVHANALH